MNSTCCAPLPASSGKRPPEIPQCDTTGTVHSIRSSDFIICAPGAALATKKMTSAWPALRRESCGTMSTSLASNFSIPAVSIVAAAMAAVRPFSLDSPPGVINQHHPWALGRILFYCVLHEGLIHQLIDGRDTEHEVWVGAVTGDWRSCCPHPHKGDFLLVGKRDDGQGDGGIDAPEQRCDPLLEDQLAGGDLPL